MDTNYQKTINGLKFIKKTNYQIGCLLLKGQIVLRFYYIRFYKFGVMFRLLTIFLFISIFNNLHACQCGNKKAVKDEWFAHEQVFVGKVVDIDSSIYNSNGIQVFCFKIQVLETFKEGFHDKYLYRSFCNPVHGGSCNYWFSKGEKYLIYANENAQMLTASTCSRTNLYNDVEFAEIANLKTLFESYNKKDEAQIIYESTNDMIEDKQDCAPANGWKYAFFLLAFTLLIILVRKVV